MSNFYNDIPVGKNNAISKYALAGKWGKSEREVRRIIAELRAQDNGDNYIIISSSRNSGFYKTDDPKEIAAYKAETMNRARHTFKPLTKINRVLAEYDNANQYVIEFNNLRAARLAAGFQAKDVVIKIKAHDPNFDKSLLSKIENNRCLPTALQLSIMAAMYGKTPAELAGVEIVPYNN